MSLSDVHCKVTKSYDMGKQQLVDEILYVPNWPVHNFIFVVCGYHSNVISPARLVFMRCLTSSGGRS